MSFNEGSLEAVRRQLTGEGVLSGVGALHDEFSLFLVQCIIILSICRVLGLLGARFDQPKVIFEIIGATNDRIDLNYQRNLAQSQAVSLCANTVPVAVVFPLLSGGILLGPSAIGRNQNYLNTIFPKSSLPLISVVANLGLVLYLFIVGMELGERNRRFTDFELVSSRPRYYLKLNTRFHQSISSTYLSMTMTMTKH